MCLSFLSCFMGTTLPISSSGYEVRLKEIKCPAQYLTHRSYTMCTNVFSRQRKRYCERGKSSGIVARRGSATTTSTLMVLGHSEVHQAALRSSWATESLSGNTDLDILQFLHPDYFLSALTYPGNQSITISSTFYLSNTPGHCCLPSSQGHSSSSAINPSWPPPDGPPDYQLPLLPICSLPKGQAELSKPSNLIMLPWLKALRELP